MNQKKKYNIHKFTELLRKFTDGDSTNSSVLSNLRVSDRILNPNENLAIFEERGREKN